MCRLIAKHKEVSPWKITSKKQPPYVEILECGDCGSWFQVTKKCNDKQLFKYCPSCGKPKKYPEV